MRPILFNKNETVFDTYGLGELNVTKGTATRECNGNYTLYAEIPVNDPMASILQKEMKLKADAGLRTKNQTFEISRIVKDSSKIVKIYGQHISHKLEYMAIRNHTILSGTAQSALARWKDALIGDCSFDVWSDIQTSATTKLTIDKATNARLALGGVEGSILDVWGGEYEFDNMTIRLHKQLGRTAPTVLEYGRNILSAEIDETIESAYTSVLPFATYTPDKPEGDTSDSQPDPITVTIPENYVDSKYKALYAHRRIKVVDFSSEFNSDSKKKSIPTADKLQKFATDYMERNSIGKPKINTKIEYVDLAKTLDYADRAWIEELELCDIVPVYYPQIGLTDETAKVTTITYDFVNERNASVEFGEIGTNVRATMQSGLAGKVDDIAKAQKDFENSLPNYLLNAQGNKVWYNRPDDGIEHKVGDIWFEKNGLYDRMYIWNGSMWEKRIDTEDVDKVKKEVEKKLEDSKKSTDLEIAKVAQKAQDALTKAGTLPDASKLSDQIKTLILNSPDLTQKVTNTFTERINGTEIYSKISGEVEKKFITIDATDSRFRQASEQVDRKVNDAISGVNERVSQTNRLVTRVNADVMQANTDISNTKLYVRDANEKIDKANQKISDVNGRVDKTDQNVTIAYGRINDTNRAVSQTNDRVDQTNRDLASTNAQVAENKRQIEVQVTNFNAVRESTKLFERILGTTEEGAPDKLSRLVMSSEIFQTEVGKYSTTGGPNMLRNSRADDGLKYWTVPTGEMTFTAHYFYFNGQKRMFSLRPGAVVKSPRFIVKRNIDYTLNILGFDNNSKYFKIYFCKRKKGSTSDFEEKQLVFDGRPQWTDGPVFNSTKVVKKSFKFNIGEFDDGYLQFEYDRNNPNKWGGLFMTELDFYEGANDRKWQPAPEDSAEPIEAVRTQVTQLAGSWSVRNINSAGDVLNSINLLANGTNRIDGRLTHITGQTIIDNAVIKDGMIDKVSANKMTTGTLDANKVNLINLNAKSVTSGTFKGLTFEGGIIRGNNGNTEINLNSNVTTYNGTAKIEFKSPHNSLEFNSNGRKAFLAPTISLGSNYPAFAFGINDQGEANSNKNFVGFKIFNQPSYRNIVLIGDVHIVKDSVNENAPYVSLVDLFNRINDNFKKLHAFRVQYNEGSPGFFDVSL